VPLFGVAVAADAIRSRGYCSRTV